MRGKEGSGRVTEEGKERGVVSSTCLRVYSLQHCTIPCLATSVIESLQSSAGPGVASRQDHSGQE